MTTTKGPPTPPLDETPEIDKVPETASHPTPTTQTDPTSSASSTTVQHQPADSPVSVAAPPVEPSEDTIYHNVFPTLVTLVIDRNYQELIRTAELFDLHHETDADESRFLLISPLVLSYLIVDNLPPARYAITRLPHPLFVHPLSQALFSLLAATWERNYAQIYLRSNVLLNLVNDAPDLSGFIPSMIAIFLDAFRLRTINLISKAYTSITLSQAESYLGLSKEELLSVVAQRNWTYEESQQILTPTRPEAASAKRVRGTISAPSSLLTFDVVADGVVLFES